MFVGLDSGFRDVFLVGRNMKMRHFSLLSVLGKGKIGGGKEKGLSKGVFLGKLKC